MSARRQTRPGPAFFPGRLWGRTLLTVILLGTSACGPDSAKPRESPASRIDRPLPANDGSSNAGSTSPEASKLQRKRKASDSPSPLSFRAQALPFTYDRGESGRYLPVEATGGGVGLLDYDGDGDLDIFFAQGTPLAEPPPTAPHSDVLLRNDGGGTFVDVSQSVGLRPAGYGQGVAIADYDGDGDPDVYVTRYGVNTLWRNDRDQARFTDVTKSAGVGCGLWSLGAAFLDYDGDGDLDLFVANYFTFDPAKAPFGHDAETGQPGYGMPAEFPGQPDRSLPQRGQWQVHRRDGECGSCRRLAGHGVSRGRFRR